MWKLCTLLLKGIFGFQEKTVADLPSEFLYCFLFVCLSVWVDGFAAVAVSVAISAMSVAAYTNNWASRGNWSENHIDELRTWIVATDGDDIIVESFLTMCS